MSDMVSLELSKDKNAAIDCEVPEIIEETDSDGVTFQVRPDISTKKLPKRLQDVKHYFEVLKQRAEDHQFVPRFWIFSKALLLSGYIVFFVLAMVRTPPFKDNSLSTVLLVTTLYSCFSKLYRALKPAIGNTLKKISSDFEYPTGAKKIMMKLDRIIKKKFIVSTIAFLILLALVCYIMIESSSPYRFRSLFGSCTICILIWITSKHVLLVNYRLVFSGLALYFFMAALMFKTLVGQSVVSIISEFIDKVMECIHAGMVMVFGRNDLTCFAIIVGSSVIVLNATINLMYYFGIMQAIIQLIGTIFHTVVGSSAIDSVITVANMFLAMTEAPLTLKPFLEHATPSEIFTLMTTGLASVAGSVMLGYISLGIPSELLIRAGILVAPCGLVLSKLSFPERYRSKATLGAIQSYNAESGYSTAIDAFLDGAISAVSLCTAIIACVLSSVTLINFFDYVIKQLFLMVHVENMSFQKLMSYLFYPVAYIIGVPKRDIFTISELIGTKTFLNEFIAFKKISTMKKYRDEMIENGTFLEAYCNQSVIQTTTIIWEDISYVIGVHACCGFANLASIGLVLSIFPTIAPRRQVTATKNVARAFLCACMANMLNASLAGLFSPYDNNDWSRRCITTVD